MTGRLAPLLLALAACGGDRVVLELHGAVPGAQQVDVTLLEPLVLAKLQLTNERTAADPTPPLEKVFYVAQRSTVRFALGDEPTDGLQFEVAGAGGAYVPLLVVRDDQGALAMGIYNPGSVFSAEVGREHVPDAVRPVGDVTIYPIDLEPVTGREANPNQPSPVGRGDVVVVRCGPGGPVSGAVWRGTDGRELRLLVPLDDDGSAIGRLDAPDLDCDDHSPGPAGYQPRGEGDRLDCDDTSFLVHAEATEQCSMFDEDCNPATTISQTTCQCAATGGVCSCVDPGPPKCPELNHSQTCKVPAQSTGSGPTPCDSRGALAALPECVGGCGVTLASAPPGWNLTIGGHGPNDPVALPAGQPLPIAVKPTTVPPTGSNVALLTVKPPTAPAVIYAVKLEPQVLGNVCDVAAPIVCDPL